MELRTTARAEKNVTVVGGDVPIVRTIYTFGDTADTGEPPRISLGVLGARGWDLFFVPVLRTCKLYTSRRTTSSRSARKTKSSHTASHTDLRIVHRRAVATKPLRFYDLTPARQELLRTCQRIHFGYLENLLVRNQEPVFADSPPSIRVDIKLDLDPVGDSDGRWRYATECLGRLCEQPFISAAAWNLNKFACREAARS